MIKIKNRYTGGVIAERDAATLRESVERLVAEDANLRRSDLRWADLRGAKLNRADLRWADLRGADLIGADLSGAKLIGADLSCADLSGADLSGADLSGANLRGAKLSGADLSGADLRVADLRDANLSGAHLSGAHLRGANLRWADLRGADMRGAEMSVSNVPVVANLHSRILGSLRTDGLLRMSSYHTCETTHCHAGWAIHLAGDEGYELEQRFGSSVAGALIIVASCPYLNGKVPDFYATDDDALAEITRLAALEAQS